MCIELDYIPPLVFYAEVWRHSLKPRERKPVLRSSVFVSSGGHYEDCPETAQRWPLGWRGRDREGESESVREGERE